MWICSDILFNSQLRTWREGILILCWMLHGHRYAQPSQPVICLCAADRKILMIWLPSRSLTASLPLKSYRNPIGKACLPTIIFQGLCQTSGGHIFTESPVLGGWEIGTPFAWLWLGQISGQDHYNGSYPLSLYNLLISSFSYTNYMNNKMFFVQTKSYDVLFPLLQVTLTFQNQQRTFPQQRPNPWPLSFVLPRSNCLMDSSVNDVCETSGNDDASSKRESSSGILIILQW